MVVSGWDHENIVDVSKSHILSQWAFCSIIIATCSWVLSWEKND